MASNSGGRSFEQMIAAKREAIARKRESLSRRSFFGVMGAGAALAASGVSLSGCSDGRGNEIGPLNGLARQLAARTTRENAAELAFQRGIPAHPDNGDEALYPNFIASYSKALPHNAIGEVDPVAYAAYLDVLAAGTPAAFETLPLGGVVKYVNPQSGLAFDLEGADSHALFMPPAPAFASPLMAAEMGEDYWMAHCRDIWFGEWDTNATIAAAISDLNNFTSQPWPKPGGVLTPASLFRGPTPGDLTGPYLSQFLWLDSPYGAEIVSRQIKTVVPGLDYMTNFAEWLAIQNGGAPGADAFDPQRRYIRNLRDLCQWVHVDVLFQGFFNAVLTLFSLGARPNIGNPYRTSATQYGFATLGGPNFISLLCEVATRALKAMWFQKWYVHRRIRPEEFAGRVHAQLTALANYPLHPDILGSNAAAQAFSRYGTYLLPMAFPEGCPTHPSYGAGHAVVAGACATMVKACFDETFVLPVNVFPSPDGLTLQPYTGPGSGALTLGGEINKLASNISLGRDVAGVHWRSDGIEGMKLGEAVAISLLEESKLCFNEVASFTFTKFDGTTITI